MFKGNLIENKNYYKLRSKRLLLSFLPGIAIGILVNFYDIPIWLTIGVLFFVVTIFVTSRNEKKIRKISDKRIHISPNEIEIREADGSLIETIEIENVDKLIMKSDIKKAQETMNDLKEELKGHAQENFIIVENNMKQRRLDFEIESYYMLNQFKKLIDMWQKRNLNIEYLTKH